MKHELCRVIMSLNIPLLSSFVSFIFMSLGGSSSVSGWSKSRRPEEKRIRDVLIYSRFTLAF